ncbi:hypothetical protein BD309DRAFT_766631 [Dichomitus squalens]|nr:hypothetical protein BD309DRAFT_766631 [Dichomitus squalens]
MTIRRHAGVRIVVQTSLKQSIVDTECNVRGKYVYTCDSSTSVYIACATIYGLALRLAVFMRAYRAYRASHHERTRTGVVAGTGMTDDAGPWLSDQPNAQGQGTSITAWNAASWSKGWNVLRGTQRLRQLWWHRRRSRVALTCPRLRSSPCSLCRPL